MRALKYAEHMPNLYESAKDLHDRLDGSIVRYDGIPYRCKVWTDGINHKLWLTDLEKIGKSNTPDHEIKIDDPLLDISILECMYINFFSKEKKNIVFYLTRNNGKHYKSGTYPSYSQSRMVDGKPNNFYPNDSLYFSKGLKEAVLGVYPSVNESLENMIKDKSFTEMEVAVSQEVALAREKIGLIRVFFRMEMIGWIDPETKKLNITNDDRRWALIRALKPLGFDC